MSSYTAAEIRFTRQMFALRREAWEMNAAAARVELQFNV